MYLSRFRVCGYKCLHEVDLALRPFHVLCGPSGSGKTSLLEAIAAYHGRFKKPSSAWFPPAHDMRSLVEHGAATSTIDLSAQWSEWPPGASQASEAAPLAGFGYTIVVPEHGDTLGVMDQWVRTPVAGAAPAGFSRSPTPYPRRIQSELPEDIAAHETFRAVVQKALLPVHVYRLSASRLAAPAVDAGQGLSLDADGLGLPAVLDALRTEWPQRYRAMLAEFVELCPEFHDIELSAAPAAADRRRKSPPPLVKSLAIRTSAGHSISATHIAGGSLLLLGYLALVHAGVPPAPLLIEHPESGLPPERLAQVLAILRRGTVSSANSEGTQVLITTHSEQVAGSAAEGELSRLA